MYKVILVDDELWVIESLKRTIKWSDYGLEVIDQASNGAEAFDKIKQLKPDIVFADIRMPEIGGLELIALTSDLSAKPLFIVVSGFAEFSYVQKAMTYGAIGYCLKPFDVDEISKALDRAIGLLNQNKMHLENELIDHLNDSSPFSRKIIETIFEKRGMHFSDCNYYIAVIALGREPVSVTKNLDSVSLKIGSNKKLYIVKENDLYKLESELEKTEEDVVLRIGISDRFNHSTMLKNAVDQATLAAFQYFIDGNRTHKYIEILPDEDFKIYNELDQALRRSDQIAVLKAFENVSLLFGHSIYTIKSAYFLYNLVTSYLYGKGLQQSENLLMSYEQLTKIFQNNDEMFEYLKLQSMKQFIDKKEYTGNEIENIKVREIIDYIDKNFYKDISIHVLAQKFYFNPNYFCQLFSKWIGQTFTDYLAKRRIEYACELLANSKAPVGEVAERCGFDNYFYFSKVFKKITQKTPTEYRSTKNFS